MVQLLLIFGKKTFLRWGMRCAGILLLSITPALASKVHKEKTVEPPPPDLLLEGGRKLHWERTFSSEKEMEKRGILVKAVSMSGLAEEAGFAYKPISDVVETVERAGITKKVAELRPIGNIKG